MNAQLIKEARDLTTGANQHRTANAIALYINAEEILAGWTLLGRTDKMAEYQKEVATREQNLQEYVNELKQAK